MVIAIPLCNRIYRRQWAKATLLTNNARPTANMVLMQLAKLGSVDILHLYGFNPSLNPIRLS
jgi:hypothetical protein